MIDTPGSIALLGSGETSLAGGRIFELLAKKYPPPVRIAIFETPAGFELNSSQVAGKVSEYFRTRLKNYNPQVEVIPARRRGPVFGTEQPEILEPVAKADIIFMGPGSPTYAVRQLAGSLAWDVLRARHRAGAALVFSSAATISVGRWVLPVYEIYKVGQDVHKVPGLDLFSTFGLPLSCVPHWNNTDGGEDVDTSRCFVGLERFKEWCDQLPAESTTLGLDEHTGLIMDFQEKICSVAGVSSVTVLRECQPMIYPSGAEFPLSELGDWSVGERGDIRSDALELLAQASKPVDVSPVPDEVQQLVDQREKARQARDWVAADQIRDEITHLGWSVQDSPAGAVLSRL